MNKGIGIQQVGNTSRETPRRDIAELAHVFVALQAELADLRKLLKCVIPSDAEAPRKQQ